MHIHVNLPAAGNATEQRRQVQHALNPRTMGGLLAEALELAQADDGAIECRILDVKYEPGEYCTVLYQLGTREVIGTIRWSEVEEAIPATARIIPALGMQVYRFEDDPALPGLATVLDGAALAHALSAVLPECQDGSARIVRCRTRPLRYRPGRRCTLRVDLWLRERDGGAFVPRTLFGKVYHQLDKAEAVFHEMQLLADSAPARAGDFIAAGIAAFLPDLALVLQQPVRGTELDTFLGRMSGPATGGDQRGWDGFAAAAPALAALHTSGLVTGRARPPSKDFKKFVSRAAKARAIDPTFGERVQVLVAALDPYLDQLSSWGAETTIIHGDCKPSQFLIGPEGIAILDFDHCGMADPASDVGNFLATLRQLGVKQALEAQGSGYEAQAQSRQSWLLDLEHHFLDTYCAASGFVPAFRQRAAWYEAVALLRKGLRSFARSPRSPLPTALVAAAEACLSELEVGERAVVG